MKKFYMLATIVTLIFTLLCFFYFLFGQKKELINNYETGSVRKVLVSFNDTEKEEKEFLLEIKNEGDIYEIISMVTDIDNSNLKEKNDWGIYPSSKSYRITLIDDKNNRFYHIQGSTISMGTKTKSSFYSIEDIGEKKIDALSQYILSIKENTGNHLTYY